MELALSTMWGLGQFKTLGEFFDAGHALGFTCFELNHGVDSRLLDGLNLNSHTIASVHEPCPADVSVARLKENDWLISSLDEDNRNRGVAAIKKSIDLAHRLGAEAVIVHPGRVDVGVSLEASLFHLYNEGKTGEPEYAEARDRLAQDRAVRAEKNLHAVKRSILELAEHAAPLGVRLGLENRYHYHEIPTPDELEMLLGLAPSSVLGFWYDVGHAQTLEQLGFFAHEEWLQRFARRMIGTHLHDVVGITDHRVAGLGDVDWDMVARYLPNGILRTCEFQNDQSPDQVVAGVKWLIAKGLVQGDSTFHSSSSANRASARF